MSTEDTVPTTQGAESDLIPPPRINLWSFRPHEYATEEAVGHLHADSRIGPTPRNRRSESRERTTTGAPAARHTAATNVNSTIRRRPLGGHEAAGQRHDRDSAEGEGFEPPDAVLSNVSGSQDHPGHDPDLQVRPSAGALPHAYPTAGTVLAGDYRRRPTSAGHGSGRYTLYAHLYATSELEFIT